MADNSFKVKKSLNIEPGSPTLDSEGDIGVNSTSHKLQFRDDTSTKSVVTEDGTATLTNKTFDANGTGNSISNIENADIKAAAAIDLNKLAATTANRALVSDASGFISPSTVTDTELGYVSGVTSSIQTQLNAISVKTAPYEQSNIGLSTSVATNALTIALKQSDGTTDPSTGSSAVTIGFRNSTSSTGSYSSLTATSALSVVVPSSATLGHISGMNQYVWVYAINNAGAIELAVSGVKLFDDYSIQSTTAISGSATSGSTMYSTVARTNVPVRLIGRLLSNQTTAGTWATGMSEVSLASGKQPVTITDWESITPTFSAGFGTVTSPQCQWMRNGSNLLYKLRFTTGTVATANGTITLPGSLTVNSSVIPGISLLGVLVRSGMGGPMATIVADGSGANVATNLIALAKQDSSHAGLVLSPVDDSIASTETVATTILIIPIQGWSTFGP